MLDLPRMLTMAQHDGVAPRARMDWSSLGGAVALAEVDELVKTVGKLEDTAYVTTVRYDAQGRAVQTRLPMSGSTHRTSYTDDGLLERIDRETAAGTHERVYEAEDFDHLGRPRSVRHGEHAARTSFTYDPVTERLLRLQSQGGGRSLQDLHYSYDPVGNLTQVRDAAQAIVYRDNAALEAVNDYRYDALYRLVEATGREHEGQAANGRTPKAGDAVVVPLRAASPSDPKAMRRYVQRYRYDAVGNLRTLQHQAGAGSFRREYAYAEHGNRLRATGNAARALHERYAYDVAGHMVAMPHLSRLHWDETDALEFVQRGTQQIWLQYAGGARVRKVVRSGEGVVEDRKYLGAEELYTKRRGGALVERTLTEHVGGALQVDIKLVADGETIAKPVALRRYALADHLGSVKLEVDPDGQVIAYEEFHPYGTTSYRAMHSGLDAAANRYRYTGMEKDEETGLARHGARYYAAWLGRWTSADPTGLADGVNRYAYCRGSPTSFIDRTGRARENPWSNLGREKTQAEYLAEQADAANGNLLAMPDAPIHDDAVAAHQARERAHGEYLIHGGGMEAQINAQRARSAQFVLAYFGILMLPAAVGSVATASSAAGRAFFASAAAFDADQSQAAVRSIATDSDVHTGFHAGVAASIEAAGSTADDAQRYARYVELAATAVFLLGGFVVPTPGRWPNKLARAATPHWSDYLPAAKAATRAQRAARITELETLNMDAGGARIPTKEIAPKALEAEIKRQKQLEHVAGTKEHTRRVADGANPSTFQSIAEAIKRTREAYRLGKPVKGRGNIWEYDFGVTIGTSNGRPATRVRVHVDTRGRIHGHPF